MRKVLCFAMLAIASLLTACSEPSNNSNAAKPANAANTANTSSTNTAASAAAIETEIKKAVTDMAASLVKGDAAYFEKLYTENYMFVGPDGAVSNGTERVASMKSGRTKYDSLAYDDVAVRTNPEGNGAISISRATVKGVNLGLPVDGQYRVTHVWSKTKDGWRLASGQTTRITGGSGPADTASNSNAARATNGNSNGGK